MTFLEYQMGTGRRIA